MNDFTERQGQNEDEKKNFQVDTVIIPCCYTTFRNINNNEFCLNFLNFKKVFQSICH